MTVYGRNMLTKTDLKQMQKLLREEAEAEGRNIRNELQSDIRESRVRIQQDIRELSDRMKHLEIRVNNAEKETKKGFQKINNRLTELFDFLDKDLMKTSKRVERIEKHLGLETA